MPGPIVTLSLDAMRTRFELVLASPDGALPEPALRAAGEAALQEIQDAESRLSLFRRDSLLAHINRTAALAPVRLDADTFDLLRTAHEVWRLSGGAFDPTIAARMTALGLHWGAILPEPPAAPPADRPQASLDLIHLDPAPATIQFRAPTALDLGAIAKGHALDLAARTLREHAIACALLHAGTSSVLAIGAPPDTDAWAIALRPPTPAPDTPPAPIVRLRDNALGVSAHHGRTAGSPDAPITHILDPRTGLPAAATARLAGVIAPTAALADAWSTAALVLGTRPPAMPDHLACILL